MKKEENHLDENSLDLIEVEPIEYAYESNYYGYYRPQRIIRYRNVVLDFVDTISQEHIDKTIANPHLKKPVTIAKRENCIFYKYSKKPEIILDLIKRKLFVTKTTFESFGERDCQQQASVLMRFLLKANGLAHFNRLQVKWDPKVVGLTPEDRKITIRALRYLCKDPE